MLMLGGTNYAKQHKNHACSKKGLDNVPNKVRWWVFNGPLTKSIFNCPWFMEGFYIQIICIWP
jgi:hypothetical protein